MKLVKYDPGYCYSIARIEDINIKGNLNEIVQEIYTKGIPALSPGNKILFSGIFSYYNEEKNLEETIIEKSNDSKGIILTSIPNSKMFTYKGASPILQIENIANINNKPITRFITEYIEGAYITEKNKFQENPNFNPYFEPDIEDFLLYDDAQIIRMEGNDFSKHRNFGTLKASNDITISAFIKKYK